MALDKLVDSTQLDADLTTVANAIRTKGSTSAQLSFPNGMADAIAAIPSGGITPTGNINITENGTYDVTQYAEAVVDVSGGGEWLLDVQQYTHAEDWTTDALGNSLNFVQTYLEYQQSGKYPFQIAYIENNAVEGNYKAKLVIYYRSVVGNNLAISCRSDNMQWGAIDASRSFYISAGAKITVLTLYHGEGW